MTNDGWTAGSPGFPRSQPATEQDYLEDNIATVAYHMGRPGARLSISYDDGPKLIVDPGEVLQEASRRLALSAPKASVAPADGAREDKFPWRGAYATAEEHLADAKEDIERKAAVILELTDELRKLRLECSGVQSRDDVIEECAAVCDEHAKWAEEHIGEPPESSANQMFATIANVSNDIAGELRRMKTSPLPSAEGKSHG